MFFSYMGLLSTEVSHKTRLVQVYMSKSRVLLFSASFFRELYRYECFKILKPTSQYTWRNIAVTITPSIAETDPLIRN